MLFIALHQERGDEILSTYVMSDIHGSYSIFRKMLQTIRFSLEDELIIAGDYIDRGEQNLEMLKWIEKAIVQKNITCLCGNHDREFVRYIDLMEMAASRFISKEIDDTNKLTKIMYELTECYLQDEMFDRYQTIHQLIWNKGVTFHELRRWADMITTMQYVKKIVIDNRRFIVVHAGYTESLEGMETKQQFDSLEDFYLYAREDAYQKGGMDDAIIIAGHSPTITKKCFTFNHGEVFKYIDKNRNCTFYCIDCGCSYAKQSEFARLSCIRLEDETIFYVD